MSFNSGQLYVIKMNIQYVGDLNISKNMHTAETVCMNTCKHKMLYVQKSLAKDRR